jgi:hypothetical protein
VPTFYGWRLLYSLFDEFLITLNSIIAYKNPVVSWMYTELTEEQSKHAINVNSVFSYQTCNIGDGPLGPDIWESN